MKKQKKILCDSVSTIILEIAKAITESCEVKSSIPEIEVQETCEAESPFLNKEIEHRIT